MKRLLIPLLAALALPTAVNAEILYLRCTPNTKQKTVFSITINEVTQSSIISTPMKDGTETLNKGSLFATSDLFIIKSKIMDFDSFYQKYEISRLNGSFTMYMGSLKYPVRIPEEKVYDGVCIKEERAKTLF